MITETLKTYKESGLMIREENGKLFVSPMSKVTDETKAFLRDHKSEVLAELTGRPVSDFEEMEVESPPTKAKPKPLITPMQYCDRTWEGQRSLGPYYAIPKQLIYGRDVVPGYQSLLECLEELTRDGNIIEVHLERRFAFTIPITVFAPDGNTLIKDTEWLRWSFDDAGVEMLRAKAAKSKCYGASA